MRTARSKTMFCILFVSLVLTSFVVAISGSGGAGGGGTSGSGGGGGGHSSPFEDIEIEINDVGINHHENLILPIGETIEITVEFESEVDDTDVTVDVNFEGQGYNIFESTELFDIEEDEEYRRTLYLYLPEEITQEEHYYLNVEIDGRDYSEEVAFYHILMDDYCEYGDIGGLHIDINDVEVTGFGSKYSWYPLDEIEVEVEIDNDADEGIDDIFVEWGIYDIEANEFVLNGIEEMEFTLHEDEDIEVLFTFLLHPDQLDITNERYFLFVKVYGDEGEHAHCYSDSKQIKLEIEDDFVVLNDITVPDSAEAGYTFPIDARAWNIGSDNQDDVSVKVYNEELEIEKVIDVGDVDSFEEEAFRIYIDIPENAEEKAYQFTLEVLDEDNDIYENSNDDEAIFSELISVIEEFSIIEIETIDHNLIEYNFVDLRIETNRISTCFIKLNEGDFEEAGCNDFFHHLDNYILEEGENLITIKCENSFGETDEKYLTENVDLTNLKEVMILEGIGNYEVGRTYMRINVGEEGIITEYEAEYYNNINNYIYDVEVYELVDRSFFEELLDEVQDFLSVRIINGHEVYFLDEGDGDYGIIWIHENLVVGIAVNNFGDEEPSFSQLVDAYLEKYPSDLFDDITPPIITLLDPEDDYVKKTKKSSYEIDFEYKVEDESEITSCSLIIDGDVEETETNVQRDIKNVFSVDLDRGSYDWQIKCVDSEGNERDSEIRDLRIKKKSSEEDTDDFDYEPIVLSDPIDKVMKESEVIVLKPELEKVGFFERIINWFSSLFA